MSVTLNGFSLTACAEAFDIEGKAAILMDASTGAVLYEKNIQEPLPPASITKIMTMLIAMESLESNLISLSDEVIISERASSMGGTQIYVETGEVKTVEELMKAIAIRSANDACVAIAEHISGNEELFIEKMNTRAKELGMKKTRFVNTNGLPAPNHLSSAYDIALMSRELLKHKKVHRWLTTWMDTVEVGKKTKTVQSLVNTNRLIRTYKGATGIKTGSTSEALYCLSASASRGDNTFIAVVLAAPTSSIRFKETAKLLDYGFANFNTVKIAKKNQDLGIIPVEKGKKDRVNITSNEDVYILVRKGEETKIKKEIIIPQSIKAPINKSEKVGEIVITLDGKEIDKRNIVSRDNIEKANVINILNRMFERMLKH